MGILEMISLIRRHLVHAAFRFLSTDTAGSDPFNQNSNLACAGGRG
jgi:hypothetical protein